MSFINKKKLGALVDKHAQKKAPPKKPFGGGKPPQPAQESKSDDPSANDDETKDVDVHEIAERVQDGDGDEDVKDTVADYDPEQDGDPPDWVSDEGKWNKAKNLVEPFKDQYGADEWVIVANVYKELGGEFTADDDDDSEDDESDGKGVESDDEG